MELPKFITFLKNKVDREIESIKDAFEQGRIPKENYDISVGELKGLRTANVDDKTRGGIYLPGKSVQEHRNVASIGKVIQMGEDAYNREDMSKPWCKLGDHVMFAKYAGHRFQFGKTELRIMNDDEILGLVPDIKNIS